MLLWNGWRDAITSQEEQIDFSFFFSTAGEAM